MKRIRIKRTVYPDNREFENLAEYRKFLDRVNDYNLWLKRIKKTKKVYYLND